jgi:hypothetical protein
VNTTALAGRHASALRDDSVLRTLIAAARVEHADRPLTRGDARVEPSHERALAMESRMKAAVA